LGPLRRKKCTHIAQFFIFLSPPKFYIQVGKLKIESFYHDFYRVWRKQPEKKLKQIVDGLSTAAKINNRRPFCISG
jgi:hypothetical protein